MSGLRETEWMSQYKMVKRSVQQKRQAGVPLTASETKELSDKVEFLARNLQIMQQSPMEYEISLSELARRQVITENLKKQVPMIATEQKRLVGGPAAAALASGSGGNGSTPAGSGAKGGETSNPMLNPYNNITNKGLIQRQKEILKMQDEAIEDISRGVDRLHNQALEIGVETELQLKVIDAFERSTDKAAMDIQAQSAHVETVKRSTSNGIYYVCIVLEVIALVVLLAIVFGVVKTN